jgi:Tol biopolymer transport system component
LLKVPTSFTPDARYLAYWASGDTKTGIDIWILPDPLGPAPAAKPHPFLRTEFDETNPRFSPDGHWMAYQSNESGKNEIYVIPFPGPGGKRQVSMGGGSSPLWRADGKELYYMAADNHLMAAEVNAGGGVFEVSATSTLFELMLGRRNAASYDVSADGQRFLVPMLPEGEVPEPLTIVQNWTAGLKK